MEFDDAAACSVQIQVAVEFNMVPEAIFNSDNIEMTKGKQKSRSLLFKEAIYVFINVSNKN